MKIFNVPLDVFGSPFNRFWKRLLLHAGIASFVALFWLPVYGYYFIVFYKFAIFIFVTDVSQSFLHILIHYKLNQKYDWITDTRKRVVYGIVLHVVGTFGMYFTVHTASLHFIFDHSYTKAFSILLSLWILPLSLVVFGMVLAISGEFFKNWKGSLASSEKLQAQVMGYKYESLRNQINPHFLLDSFTTLKKFVQTDKEKAATFIQMISNLYRHVLDVKDKEFIPLEEELEYIKPYLLLINLRYENQINVSIDVRATPDDLIIPLALQSLIEHAVEHSLPVNRTNATIVVIRRNDHIEVSNSKQHGVFVKNNVLKNIEQQYQFYSNKPVMCTETSTLFTVHIPVLKQVL
jgi:sensor histidine kinase YesM